jgi:hypothetical protein
MCFLLCDDANEIGGPVLIVSLVRLEDQERHGGATFIISVASD